MLEFMFAYTLLLALFWAVIGGTVVTGYGKGLYGRWFGCFIILTTSVALFSFAVAIWKVM